MSDQNPNFTAAGQTGGAQARGPELGPDELIILPVRNFVLFPGVVMPVIAGRASSVAAAQEAVRRGLPVGILMQRDAAEEEATALGMHRIGVSANVLRFVTAPDGTHHLIAEGQQRFFVESFVREKPYMIAKVRRIEEPEGVGEPDIEARFMNLRSQAVEALQLLPQTPPELLAAVNGANSASSLTDLVAAYLDVETDVKQDILQTIDLAQRMDKVAKLLAQRIEVMRLSHEIGKQTKASLDERQREVLLREQMAAIQKQLGEDEGKNQELADLGEAIGKAGMPEDVEKMAKKELRRLERMPDASAEYGMIRTYLDTLIELPWAEPVDPPIDIDEARRVLDEDHYGLDKIKKRIIEFLAVRKLAPTGKAPILCFVGPPGVGKTSLGQSIARAMGRKFVRVSLGGVHDEAEIRGHRRTYVGAMAGNIIQGIRKVGERNCVMMLDEIDKMGSGVHGDPAAAMLEVLDPEQNGTFRDNYLGVPFDLSRVVFIATANMLESIPGPLRDRMEVIGLGGYTDEEKLQIAKRYLVPRARRTNGLGDEQASITDEAVVRIIRHYTREAGVRNLEREIARAFRRTAVEFAQGHTEPVAIGVAQLHDLLGAERFEDEVAMRVSVPGVATGLAWTPVGGDILFIEAARVPGSGRLQLTGQLGDVMRESAQAAMSLVKSRAGSLGIESAALEKSDIHVHVPAGAIPKDGPSAGVAMYTALVSALTGRTVRADTAMTGEISLRGLVLPVGGIKEKVIAADRAGITRVMLPARNRRDYEEIPEDVRNRLAFIWLETVDQAIANALETAPAAASPSPALDEAEAQA
ncbi:endopeptidase La [Verticiella sediminum]|uniref:Lon protease n=1 Tax=Verticiella sediminum TaxID=1247510 RepID=A0A556AYI9_9BURK|nr:endopeptidase La [Verticiella sediminum]TSH98010.1 endopeptidase La [Verticiella sediminum]